MLRLKTFQDADSSEPNYELLRGSGWVVNQSAGRYCVAWRPHEEAVFVWRQDGWHQVSGRSAGGQRHAA